MPKHIDFKDPFLNKIYQELNEYIYKNIHMRTFDYTNVLGDSMMYIKDEIRFIQKKGSSLIEKELFDRKSKNWISHSVVKKEPYSFNLAPSTECIMWPIKKVYIQNPGYNLSRVIQNFFDIFEEKDENKKNMSNCYKNAVLNKKMNQLLLVTKKKWSTKINKVYKANHYGAYKFWWENFVDKKTFKSLYKVYGMGTQRLLYWTDYVDFVNLENKAETIENIQKLGLCAQLLVNLPMENWKNHTEETLLPQQLFPLWEKIKQEPYCIQEEFIRYIQKNSHETLSDVFHVYINVVKDEMLSKREKLMVLTTANQILNDIYKQDIFSFSSNINTTKKDLKLNKELRKKLVDPNHSDFQKYKDYLLNCVKLWRSVEPKQYQNWGDGVKYYWSNLSQSVIQFSIRNGNFSIPEQTTETTETLEKMKILLVKNNIEKEIKQIAKEPRVKQKIKI